MIYKYYWRYIMDKITYYLGAHSIHLTRIGFVQNTKAIKDED